MAVAESRHDFRAGTDRQKSKLRQSPGSSTAKMTRFQEVRKAFMDQSFNEFTDTTK